MSLEEGRAEDRDSTNRRDIFVLAAIVLLGAALRLRLLSVPFERDEGEYAYAGQLILQGVVPYDLAYTMKLPGVATAYAAIMALFGQSDVAIHFGLLLISAVTTVMIYAVGRRWLGRFAGLAGAAFFSITGVLNGVQGLWANAEHFVLPFALGGILVFANWLSHRRLRSLFVSGLLLGCALLMKQHGAGFLLFVGLLLCCELWSMRSEGWRAVGGPVAALSLGALLPILLVFAAIAAAGDLDRFLLWTTDYALIYATANSLEVGWGQLLLKGGALFRETVAISLLALAGFFALDRTRDGRRATLEFCAFALVSFGIVSAGLLYRPHYFVLLLPAATLLAGASLGWLQRTLRVRVGHGVGSALSWGALALVMIFTIGVNRDYLLRATPAQVMHYTYGSSPFVPAAEIGRVLGERSDRADRIAVVGSEPQIYFYAKRLSATGFIYTYPLMEDQPLAASMQREMASEIEAAAPRYLVYVNDSRSWMYTKRSDTWILEWFERYSEGYRVIGWSGVGKQATVRWGTPTAWPPRVQRWIGVYERIELD